MIFADLPPQYQERIVCSVMASVTYDVPANIILAVAELENGKSGMYRPNANGTQDVGVMQMNTQYLADLSGYGITANDVADSSCYPYMLATWRLHQHIVHDKGDLWTKAANYHSRTPRYNSIYRAKLKIAARHWADWLKRYFNTRIAGH
jgi:hypothetical protein